LDFPISRISLFYLVSLPFSYWNASLDSESEIFYLAVLQFAAIVQQRIGVLQYTITSSHQLTAPTQTVTASTFSNLIASVDCLVGSEMKSIQNGEN